jgi:hypothetical protein
VVGFASFAIFEHVGHEMSKVRPTIGIDGLPLPILPPERDARVWARLVRVMFYTPGFLALLLIKAGEPTSFGITVELLMLSSGAAIIGGLYIGTESSEAGSDRSSKIGVWSTPRDVFCTPRLFGRDCERATDHRTSV